MFDLAAPLAQATVVAAAFAAVVIIAALLMAWSALR
jgi:hypothetical protein